MDLGIFAKTFSRPELGETLDAVRDSGLRVMQFNLALAGGPSLPDAIDAGPIREAVATRGLAMAAVSGTYNMAHPDPAVRAGGLRRLGVVIAAAPALGTRVVTLCTGTRDPDDMWRAHPDNATPAAWRDMLEGVAAAVALAEAHGVTLGTEPEHGNVVRSAAAGRRLLDEIGSPHLRVVIDAANLVEGELPRQHEILAEAFDLLGDDLVLAHAKDVRPDGSIVAAGQGELDYPAYLEHLRGRGVPLILHGLEEADVPGSVAMLTASPST